MRSFLMPQHGVRRIVGNVFKYYPMQSVPYYLLLHFWMKSFGNSSAATAALSSLAHIFVFPAAAWLFYEIYGWTLSSFLGLVLVAISPLQIYFSQEIRSYQLWIVMMYLLHAALLRALRRTALGSWAIYGIIVCCSLFLSLFAVPLWLSHLGVVWVLSRRGDKKALRSFVLTSGVAMFLFTPYLIASLAHSYGRIPSELYWAKSSSSYNFLRFNGESFLRIFFDFLEDPPAVGRLYYFGAAFLFVIYCVRYICMESTFKLKVLLLAVAATNYLPFWAWDLTHNTGLSTPTRYLLPTLLLVQLAVARTLAVKLDQGFPLFRTAWKLFTGALIVLQVAWVFSSRSKPLFVTQNISLVRDFLIRKKSHDLLINVSGFDGNRTQGGSVMLNTLAMAYNLPPSIKVMTLSRDSAESLLLNAPSYVYSPEGPPTGLSGFDIIPIFPPHLSLWQISKVNNSSS